MSETTMEPPAICPTWAIKKGLFSRANSGPVCTNCGMPRWEHLTVTEPRALVQHSCNEFPYLNEWIPYAMHDTEDLLGITATMECGTSRTTVRVIGARPGLIMLGLNARP